MRSSEVRYQAALRPDKKCALITRHSQTGMLFQQANLALHWGKIASLSHLCARIQTSNQSHFVELPLRVPILDAKVRSAGRLCIAPGEIAFLFMDFILHSKPADKLQIRTARRRGCEV